MRWGRSAAARFVGWLGRALRREALGRSDVKGYGNNALAKPSYALANK